MTGLRWRDTLLGIAPAVLLVGLGSAIGAPALGLAGVLVSALLAWRLEGGGRAGWRALGLVKPPSLGGTITLGLATAAAMRVLLGGIFLPLLTRLFGPADLSAFELIRGHPERLAVMLLIPGINGGFAEEIVFRGFLMRRLELHAGGGGPGLRRRLPAGEAGSLGRDHRPRGVRLERHHVALYQGSAERSLKCPTPV